MKEVKYTGIILVMLILLFVVSSGCTEVATGGAKAAAKVGTKESRSSISLAAPVAHAAGKISQDSLHANSGGIPVFNESITLEYNHNIRYLLAGDAGYQFNIGISTDGAPVDILVMDEANHDKYSNAFSSGSAASFDAITYSSVVSQNFQYVLPAQGKYYLVIENSGFLSKGADAGRDVMVQVTVNLIR